MQRLRIAILAIFAISVSTSRSDSRTWSILENHSGDAPTIQAGIDSAADGDTVLVHAGTYPEQLVFNGKPMTVLAASGPVATIVSGSGMIGNVVTFQQGEGRESRLEGFTIQGGFRGIGISNSEPTIDGNIITGNGTTPGNLLDGAGIVCFGVSDRVWSPLITGNDIRQNVATANGGGLAVEGAMAPEVLHNTIHDNQANQNGGGIYVFTQEIGTVLQHNVIDSNVALLQGGGIYVQGAGNTPLSIDIGFSVLSKNSARGTGSSIGGGAYLNNTSVVGHHLTVVENTVPAGQIGGGIAFDGGTPHLDRCIIAMNTAGGGIGCSGGATPVIVYTIGWSNAGGNGSGTCSNWDQTDANLVVDPLFCNLEEGDFTVASDSPAMTSLGAPIGAFTTPGCSGTPALPITWGSLKTRFR